MTRAPRGTRDILPEETPLWKYLESKAHLIAETYRYGEIRTPVFEHAELFYRVGEDTDLVQKEMYVFEDRAGRSLALRPEGTAAVVRAFIEHGMEGYSKPVKLYYIGPMFRYERPQAGRYRQHYQFGAEALGSLDPALDAEVISLICEFASQIGLKLLKVGLNSIGCPQCRANYKDKLRSFFSEVVEQLCEDCRVRYERNVLRILDCKVPDCQVIIKSAPGITDFLCDECLSHFEKLQTYLKALEIEFYLNPRLVRGLDYYTKTVFEVTLDEMGANIALGGGGRYDGLVEACGGKPTPGVGFGMGLDRVVMALQACGLEPAAPKPLDVFIVLEGNRKARALKLLQDMRRRGLASDVDYGDRSLKAQLKRADKLGAAWVVFLGTNEDPGSLVSIKNMRTGDQEFVPESKLIDVLVERLQPWTSARR